MLLLGIDVGGTKAIGRLADERGDVLLETRGPGATLQAGGTVAVEHALRQILLPALRETARRLDAICLGMAGVDRSEDAATVRAMLARLSRMTSVLVVNDALIALEAGIGSAPGIVIVAGTGSIAYGRDDAGRAARAGGWGYVLGDEGSGYWLGRQALHAVVRAADRRGPATSLTSRILSHFGITRPQDLVREVYFHQSQPAAIAGLSGLVHDAAVDGDAVATGILDAAAGELAGAGLAVAGRLGLAACPMLLAGGVFRASPMLVSRVVTRVRRGLPGVNVELLEGEPVAGAVRLALALAEGRATIPEYADVMTPG